MISRARAIEALAGERFDLVVVGGGITGAGVALDAASRGYSVALVEKADFASGTSSRSSKLVHGGLRYLQQFDLGLVREALLERQLMVKLAPHLVHPIPLVVAALDAREPTSGYLFYDCQTDDVRLVLTVLGEAERFGAICANRLQVTELVEEDGRASGVRVVDTSPDAEGEGFVISADNVVNAT